MLLINQWISEQMNKSRWNQTTHGEKWKHISSKYVGCSKVCFKREIRGNTSLTQETKIILNKQSNLTTKETTKEEQSPNSAEGGT